MPHTQLTAWQFRFDSDSDWQPIHVPGCWETFGGPKNRPGPAWYRTTVDIPTDWADQRIWLHFGAVSYHCELFVNGQPAGTHTGMWDAFAFELTSLVAPGQPAELLLRVEKPADLTAGPDSPTVPGRFPLRETLAGFLPYVWGHTFGGIWQHATLSVHGPAHLLDACIHADANGHTILAITTDQPAAVAIDLLDPHGNLLCTLEGVTAPGDSSDEFEAFPAATPVAHAPVAPHSLPAAHQAVEPTTYRWRASVQIGNPQKWSPTQPVLYSARIRLDGHTETQRFGCRTFVTQGRELLLNGLPCYPRMALSWGWYADRLTPNPEPERIRADFAKLKALGYNGIKCCLWIPPPVYLDIADELGILVWIELPMWLPRPTEHFRRQVAVEYPRLVQQLRRHTSVVFYTLGCELNAQVGADILAPLYGLLKDMLGNRALVRDNSGSGEAYGGLLNEFADFYDYHFYCDLQFMRALLDAFTAAWRPPQPWLFGEFCDHDTFRDLRRITSPAHAGIPAHWWLSSDPVINPQGARWQMDVHDHERRLRAAGLWERGAEFERLSYEHALLHRKLTLELVRSVPPVGGYVITGEVDTPISTAGMWNDLGELKCAPEAFRAFNQDTVALLGWDQRRAWIHGGDRLVRTDRHCFSAGSQIRPHLLVAHHGSATGPAHVAWSVIQDDGTLLASGTHTTSFVVQPGTVRELCVAEFNAPHVVIPMRAQLRVQIQIGTSSTENDWPLWFFPSDAWNDMPPLALFDPLGCLHDLVFPGERIGAPAIADCTSQIIATAWSQELDTWVRQGGRAILLQAGEQPGPVPTRAMPFWREALRIIEAHPAWGTFPHTGWAGLQYYGCATDTALKTAHIPGCRPLLRRIDTRTMAQHDYAAELPHGAGRLLISTLRLEGGTGDQPTGIAHNPAAQWMLAAWARHPRRPHHPT